MAVSEAVPVMLDSSCLIPSLVKRLMQRKQQRVGVFWWLQLWGWFGGFRKEIPVSHAR